MTLFRLARTALLVAIISGCSSYVPRIVNEYKIDIQQGNLLTQEMVSQLKLGQTKDQVRFILGTPVLMDMFHANRWDYVYRLRKGNSSEVEMRKLTTLFDADNKLIQVIGDVTAAQGADASAVPNNRTREIDLGSIAPGAVPPPLEEKGFFRKILEKIGF